MKYVAAYKCPLCNTVIKLTSAIEFEEDKLPALLASVVKNQQMIGTSLHIAPMYIPHRCKEGNAGLAQFGGFIKEC